MDALAVPDESIRRWTDRLIVVTVPENLESGLVRVTTAMGESNPVFLTVVDDLPVRSGNAGPQVQPIAQETYAADELLTVEGYGFGPRSAMARLSFRRLSGEGEVTIDAADDRVVLWTDRRIEVVLPPRLVAGEYLLAVNGFDIPVTIAMTEGDGMVTAGEPGQYALRMAVVAEGAGERLFAVLPTVPTLDNQQPTVSVLRENRVAYATGGSDGGSAGIVYPFPAPVGDDPADDDEHRAQSAVPQRVERVVLVTRRPVRWELSRRRSSEVLLEPWFQRAFDGYLSDGEGLPRSSDAIGALRRRIDPSQPIIEIVRSIHRVTVSRLSPDPERMEDLDVLLSRDADEPAAAPAYAALAVTLARSVGVPARRHFGVLVDDAGQAIVHAWAEFYVAGAGWIPADPAVGDGMYADRVAALRSFYGEDPVAGTVGSLDGRRVTLSMDGSAEPAVFPLGSQRSPADSWSPGVLRVESPDAGFPEALNVRWEAPQLFGWLR